MVTVIVMTLAFYGLSLFLALSFISHAWQQQSGSFVVRNRLSVVIPFRNESESLPALLKGLSEQDYPSGMVEFIFVDDHSADESVAIVAASPLPSMKVLSLPQGRTGKKQALTLGAQSASGNILVFTDADCVHGPGWLTSMNNSFSDNSVRMAIGLVRILPYGAQSLEFSSLAAVTALSTFFGKPLMCNGANLACRRDDFFQVGGYEGNMEIASGDDEFLMRKFKEQYPNGIRLTADPGSLVTTAPQHGLIPFLQQRIRWAGKWKHNEEPYARISGLLVLLTQLATITGWYIFFTSGGAALLAALVFRHALEAVFLQQTSLRLEIPFRLPVFLTVSIIYPFYVIAIGVVSLFTKARWKGRIASV